MRRRQVSDECPVELSRFVPGDWPATSGEVELMGEQQRSAFHAWVRWLHARADFAEHHNLAADTIPDHTTKAMWRRVENSLD